MVRQKYLSQAALIVSITFMCMYPPFATDMYLPALPEMGRYFGASEFLVGMTLTIFFLMFALSMVVFGPISDKYGRKPILIFGSGIFMLASVACALAPDIYVMLAGRFLQGVGSGAVITVATAVIKDCFRSKILTRILVITQSLGVIAPMAAPLIGGFLLRFTDWHGAFYVLILLGAMNLVLSCLYTETLPPEKRYKGSVFDSFKLLKNLAEQKAFMTPLIMFALLSLPFMAYLSVSSFVYMENFKLSAQEYSYFFAANASTSVMGPIIYLKLKDLMSNERLIEFCFLVSVISGVAVLIPGHWSAWAFLFSFLPFTVIGTVARPFAMEILLNRAKENVGTASSMINFVPSLFGSMGMALGTLPWGDFVSGLAIIILGATACSIFMFRFVDRL
ncbi:MAG: Bcr/CflA family efflux MFS transporter [Selenomonadaceae bacterium]|nr:Bcr/CflA family efflux MFS transporter [Selenomonadaceae bacterium]